MTPLFHPLIQVACAHPYFTPAALVVIAAALPVCENLLTRVPGPRLGCTYPLAKPRSRPLACALADTEGVAALLV